MRFHPRFLTFAREYSFLPWACHVRAAWEKGKIERVIGYARTSFGPLRTFTDLAFKTDCEPVCDWKDRVMGRFPDTFELYQPQEIHTGWLGWDRDAPRAGVSQPPNFVHHI